MLHSPWERVALSYDCHGHWGINASTRTGATKTISNSAKAGSGVLTASLNEAPVSLDPEGAESVNGGTDEVCGNTLSGLVTRRGRRARQGPSHLELVATERRYVELALNPQARWSNGTPVTSADVKASLEETIKLGGPTSPLFAAVTTVDTPSASDVVIHTSTPVGELLANLTMLYVGPAADVANPTYWNKPLSSGPYMVENFVPDESVTLVANPDWWGAPAKVHEVKLTFYANETDETTAVASGSLDYAFDLTETQLQDLQHASGVTVGSLPSY